MHGVDRALALTDQGLLRLCCHLNMIKHRVRTEVHDNLKIVAYAGEDLRRQAYHRFG